ncbi:response regulator transcription factor [Aliiroseovarius crassostreae]|uniref:response regulator transcription factor n=1 Tax=Aliiroseovarius crassostreae TaxID=154981 RepID=UPI0021FDB616|nr:response regulator transcription factor [Aliiroseovarius crassostreae]UWP89633.1 response regulator transcription factor [Aliiroseovarius crassostreae]UWQ02282.1 response regulator transcription factor [Aliiroseovarius crassostreae]
MKILVAVEDPTLSNSLNTALDTLPFHERLLVSTSRQALEAVTHGPFDLIILDYQLPDLQGMNTVSRLSRAFAQTKMALALRGGSLELAQRAQQAGANAVLSRELDATDLARVLPLALRGKYVTLLNDLFHVNGRRPLSHLSEREIQVLRGLCDGLQNKEIAHSFSIQEVTVKMHMRAVVRKLGAKNRTHAAMIARDLNLI